MDKALGYLWLRLQRGRILHFARGLRRPGTLVGFAVTAGLVVLLFHFRDHELIGRLIEPKAVAGGALLMVIGSLFKGFLQRGLVFDPAEIDFLFTGPFTQRQVIFYRLLSNYLYSILQGLIFLVFFFPHLRHPLVVAVCVILFQIACFHLGFAAAIYAGSLPSGKYDRIRWMMLGCVLLLCALYLRVAWGVKLVPHWLTSPMAGLLFYPAVTLPDIVQSTTLRQWLTTLVRGSEPAAGQAMAQAGYLCGFLGCTLGTWWLLMRVKGNVFEPALAPSVRRAERRVQLLHGAHVVKTRLEHSRSARMPRLGLFGGVRAIVWKNWIVARRSKRELLWVCAFASIYTSFTFALLVLYHHLARKAGVTPPASEVQGFHIGIALFLAGLTFFLQRMVPFDFRRDGRHLAALKTLPVSALGLALAELTVPTLLCLLLQAPCLFALLWFGGFPLITLLLLVLAFPAIGLALNAVWNLHYLLAAAKRTSGETVTAVGTLIIVVLSFLVFYPAGWTILWLGRHLPPDSGILGPLAAGVSIQYALDVLLILGIGRVFHRSEVGHYAT